MTPRARRLASTLCLAGIAAFALACPDPAPVPGGPDLFRVAVNGVSGGSLLSAWGDDVNGRAFLAGGFVGVDVAQLGATPAGRLVEYTRGRFTTRCTTDAALWWVAGANGTVWAVGDRGRVLRYRDGACETIDTGLTWAEGAPTFWGVQPDAMGGLWLVGGSASPDGPHGVLVRYDGAQWSKVDVPESVRGENLYKIAFAPSGEFDTGIHGELVIVGSGGVILRGNADGWVRDPVPEMRGDNRLFTVSCAYPYCTAVGGSGSGVVYQRAFGTSEPQWRVHLAESDAPGLNGCWQQDGNNLFMVGVNGYTAHSNGYTVYRPAARTMATLHGVGGIRLPSGDPVVIAVGGELDVRAPTQRGVILVRGDDSASFTFDGQTYMAVGELRRSLGGTGQ